jgi:hypothetical protein
VVVEVLGRCSNIDYELNEGLGRVDVRCDLSKNARKKAHSLKDRIRRRINDHLSSVGRTRMSPKPR